MKKENMRKQLSAAGYKPPQPPPVKASDLKAVPRHRIARKGDYKTP